MCLPVIDFSSLVLGVEIWVEHADLGDPLDREVVACSGLADGLRARPVVDAERLPLVVAHVRVDPRDSLVRVALDDAEAQLSARGSAGNPETFREDSLDYVPRHHAAPFRRRLITRR